MQITNMHFIQKHILRTLSACKWARFRDMKPEGVESNLYNYHLKLLLKGEMVDKVDGKGYRLGPDGLRFVDHVSLKKFEPRWQPKLLTMIVAVNAKNEILMWPKYKQPFIGLWSLPSGKMHYDDPTIEAAVRREISYFSAEEPKNLEHKGVIEFRGKIRDKVVSHTIAHVFAADLGKIEHDHAKYIPLSDRRSLEMSPGTREIIDNTLSSKEFFYKNFEIDW